MPFSALLYLYKAFVLPLLIYCAVVWAPYNACYTSRLEKFQRRITRVLMYRKQCSGEHVEYTDRLSEFGLLSVDDLFKFQRLQFCFKLLNDIGPASFMDFFHRSRISQDRFLHWRARTNSFYNSVFVSFPRLWENIPLHTRQASSLPKFKFLSKQYFLTS